MRGFIFMVGKVYFTYLIPRVTKIALIHCFSKYLWGFMFTDSQQNQNSHKGLLLHSFLHFYRP